MKPRNTLSFFAELKRELQNYENIDCKKTPPGTIGTKRTQEIKSLLDSNTPEQTKFSQFCTFYSKQKDSLGGSGSRLLFRFDEVMFTFFNPPPVTNSTVCPSRTIQIPLGGHNWAVLTNKTASVMRYMDKFAPPFIETNQLIDQGLESTPLPKVLTVLVGEYYKDCDEMIAHFDQRARL